MCGFSSLSMSSSSSSRELYRVCHGWTQKLPPAISSLHSSAAYLLIDSSHKSLQVFIGKHCNHLDRVLCENIGHLILRDEFKLSSLANPIPIVNETDLSSSPLQSFSNFFQIDSKEIPKDFPSDDLQNDLIYISELSLSSSSPDASMATTPSLEISIELKHVFTISLNSTKIIYPPFTPHSVILFECGSYERYLWIGKKILRKFHQPLLQFAEQHPQAPLILPTSPLLVIRDGMEPLLYLEKFKNIQETFPKFQHSRRHSDGGAAVTKVIVKKSIDNEMPRMMGDGFGTLSMVSQGLGSDSPTAGLKMEFIVDTSSEASLWKIDARSRKFLLVPEEERGIFCSHGCYALLYRYTLPILPPIIPS